MSRPASRRVRILEFNVSCFWGMAALKAPPLTHLLQTAVRHMGVEVVVLVEAWDATLQRHLAAQMGEEWAWVQRPQLAAGILVGVRGEIRKVGGVSFDTCCQLDCMVSKGALHVCAAVRGREELDVIAVHLQSYERYLCDARRAQIRQVRRLGLSLRPRPVVVVGDFNVAMFDRAQLFPEFVATTAPLGTPATVVPRLYFYDHDTWTFAQKAVEDVRTLSTYPYSFGTGPGIVDYAVLMNGGPQDRIVMAILNHRLGLAFSDHYPMVTDIHLQGHNNLPIGRSKNCNDR